MATPLADVSETDDASRKPRNLGLVTFRGFPELAPDDRLLLEPLARRGIAAAPVVWDDPLIDWNRFDALVLRSTWDYYLRPEAFLAWLDAVPCSQVWNPRPLVRWNADKRYLLDLQARGAEVVPTRLVPRGSDASLEAALHADGWPRVVAKPAVSANAHRTLALEPGRAREVLPELTSMVQAGDVLLQRFQPEVAEEGEWSLLFFSGVYSHAILKLPREGDFRVQEHLGGTSLAVRPPSELIRQAEAVLELVDRPWLYARVDGLRVQGRLCLMELEMIEPSLFLGTDPSAAERYAAAIAARLT